MVEQIVQIMIIKYYMNLNVQIKLINHIYYNQSSICIYIKWNKYKIKKFNYINIDYIICKHIN